jgi:hypothetical protein
MAGHSHRHVKSYALAVTGFAVFCEPALPLSLSVNGCLREPRMLPFAKYQPAVWLRQCCCGMGFPM